MKKTYLFDFDGTLVDSMPTFGKVMLRILDENGIKYEDDIINKITPLGFKKTAEYFLELGMKKTMDELTMIMYHYFYDEYVNNIPAKNNVEKVLKELKSRGASLNVLTASPHVTLDPCLQRLGLFDLFDNVWSCDDFNTSKSNPEIYSAVAQRLNVSVAEILFLDDNYNADKTAKTAGMKVCGVYDKSSDKNTDKIKQIADYYIYDFDELLSIEF